MVRNRLLMPVPLSGGSTSKEKAVPLPAVMESMTDMGYELWVVSYEL